MGQRWTKEAQPGLGQLVVPWESPSFGGEQRAETVVTCGAKSSGLRAALLKCSVILGTIF